VAVNTLGRFLLWLATPLIKEYRAAVAVTVTAIDAGELDEAITETAAAMGLAKEGKA
jgi:hypothetical protein